MLENVAAIFFEINPDLPTPVTITFFDLEIISTALIKFSSIFVFLFPKNLLQS